MIPKIIAEVQPADIEALIANQTSESATLEFKRSIFGNADGDRKEFLADVSAFANSSGGDLILGLEEKNGCAARIIGTGVTDIDAEILRVDGLVSSGIDPRIRYEVKALDCDGKIVFLMRIEKSWNPPHRVVLKGHDKFYGRNAAGKFPMDVQQLRRSFTDSASVAERVRNFRADRLMSIVRNDTPIEMDLGSKLVLHILPIEAFSSTESHDLGAKHSNINHYRPMNASGWNERITLEGRLVFNEYGGSSKSYLHVYRTGIVEAVEGTVLNHVLQDGKKNLPSLAYERLIIERLPGYMSILQSTGVQPPFLIGLSLTDIKGAYIGIDNAWMYDHDLRPVMQQHLVLPEVILQRYTDDVLKVIKPSFDLVWNACGLPKSRNFDENDNWAPSR